MSELLTDARKIIERMLTAETFLRDADPEAYKRAVKRNVREGQKWLDQYKGEGGGDA